MISQAIHSFYPDINPTSLNIMTTPKFRSYNSWEQQASDELSEWFWGCVTWFILSGIAISVPMFAVGAMSAPEGTNRWETGTEYTVAGHAVIWSGVAKVTMAVVGVIDNIMSNESPKD